MFDLPPEKYVANKMSFRGYGQQLFSRAERFIC